MKLEIMFKMIYISLSSKHDAYTFYGRLGVVTIPRNLNENGQIIPPLLSESDLGAH